MAITSLTLPDNNSSAHDDLYVVANSDNANAVIECALRRINRFQSTLVR